MNLLNPNAVLRAVLVDDEAHARTLARVLLERLQFPKVEVVCEAPDVPQGIEALHAYRPDVLLLDIEMPKISGLELPGMIDLDEIPCALVFLTAYQEYALRAFELSAVDYLLKPLQPLQLAKAMQRVAQLRAGALLAPRLEAMMAAMAPGSKPKRIALPLTDGVELQDLDAILYLQASDSYTLAVRTNGPPVLVCRQLRDFEKLLEGYAQFFRPHRSYLVNLSQAQALVRTDGLHLKMADGARIPVAKGRKDPLTDALSASLLE